MQFKRIAFVGSLFVLVAQLEEHRPSKARVGGSNPSWHTNHFYGGCSSVG